MAGTLTIDRGGAVHYLVGYGNFTVNGTIMHMEATETSKLILLSSGNTTNLMTRSYIASSLNRLVGTNSTNIALRNTIVTVVSSENAGSNSSDDSVFMEFEDTTSVGTAGGEFSLIATGGTWSGLTSRWIRLIGSSQGIAQSSRGRFLNVSVTAVRLQSISNNE